MNIKIANIIATYFGLGNSKYAPGTVGSLGSLPLAYLLIYLGGFWALIIASILIFFIGSVATKIVINHTNDHDPSKVVIDETVGQLLSFSIIAFLDSSCLLGISSIIYYIFGFAFFRLFDIVKLGPVKYADSKIDNEYGVMLDDVFAGIIASICLLVVLFIKINFIG